MCALAAAPSAHDEELARTLAANENDVFYHVPPSSDGTEIYSDQYHAGPFDQAVGLTFDVFNRMWVWEKEGKVWFVQADGDLAPQPLIDISEEVGNWGAHGLLGVAFDNEYHLNGYFYLFYVVDHHHLMHFGEASYDPQVSDDYTDTIARIVRYRLDPLAPPFSTQADPASRLVLVGEDEFTGFPVCATTHGVGSLAFGGDGSLLASFGDSYLKHTGSGHCQTESLVSAAEDIDAYRAQLRNSLAGKVIRIDPETGDGLPSNPFFNPLEPRSAESRVWAMGLRQPYRMTVRPGTGTTKHPGSIYLGDVGAQTWEELNVIQMPGMNFGWPLYEGMELNSFYFNQETANLDAPNPLFGQNIPGVGTCNQEFFDVQDLLHQEWIGPLDLPNPCDPSQQVPLDLQAEHIRPILAWKHDEPIALSKVFSGGLPASQQLGEPGTTIAGDSFPGNSAIGGVWYTGNDFPATYSNTYFLGDYGEGWIKALHFDAQDRLQEVVPFSDDAGSPVAFATHPLDGGLFYIRYIEETGGSSVRRVKFVGDQPPVAVATADVLFGEAPLGVQFDGAGSYDPEGTNLTYEWDFGDGSDRVTDPSPLYVFNAAPRVPTAFTVTLHVTDGAGETDQTQLIVSVNNTHPVAIIAEPANGSTYSSTMVELVLLESAPTDVESFPAELDCQWEVILYHDNHTHPEPQSSTCLAGSGFAPHTEDGDIEFYEVRLTVTDPHGLSDTVSHWLVRDDDCNVNGFTDAVDIAMGWSLDGDLNGIPDECGLDCDGDGLSDALTVGVGAVADCNDNGVPDSCDLVAGTSLDLDRNGILDECQELNVDFTSISMAAGGTQTLTLHPGAEYAGDLYWILGSMSGTVPASPFGPVVLPLATPDIYFDLTLSNPQDAPFVNWFGFLDGSGNGTAQISFPPGSPYAGISLYHSSIVVDATQLAVEGILLATNPVSLDLVP